MAVLSTIFKIPQKAQISAMKLDASVKESHEFTAEVTENEIEDGSIISDHIRLKNPSITIEGFISDAPVKILGLAPSTDDFLGAARDFESGDKGAFEGLVKAEKKGPKDAWIYLEQLMKARTPFSIVTSLRRYENVVLTKLSAPRSVENGRSLAFSAELKQITIVKTQTVKIPAYKLQKGGAANSGQSKNDLGKQATKGASAEQEDNSSLLLKGFKKVGIFQ